jgi:hypothetical protein
MQEVGGDWRIGRGKSAQLRELVVYLERPRTWKKECCSRTGIPANILSHYFTCHPFFCFFAFPYYCSLGDSELDKSGCSVGRLSLIFKSIAHHELFVSLSNSLNGRVRDMQLVQTILTPTYRHEHHDFFLASQHFTHLSPDEPFWSNRSKLSFRFRSRQLGGHLSMIGKDTKYETYFAKSPSTDKVCIFVFKRGKPSTLFLTYSSFRLRASLNQAQEHRAWSTQMWKMETASWHLSHNNGRSRRREEIQQSVHSLTKRTKSTLEISPQWLFKTPPTRDPLM